MIEFIILGMYTLNIIISWWEIEKSSQISRSRLVNDVAEWTCHNVRVRYRHFECRHYDDDDDEGEKEKKSQ